VRLEIIGARPHTEQQRVQRTWVRIRAKAETAARYAPVRPRVAGAVAMRSGPMVCPARRDIEEDGRNQEQLQVGDERDGKESDGVEDEGRSEECLLGEPSGKGADLGGGKGGRRGYRGWE
jgi:hypothetical protein